MRITRKDFRLMLEAVKGVTFLTLISVTTPKFRGGKSCPYQGRVRKVGKTNACVGFNYERSVNKVRTSEGLEPRQAGRHWSEGNDNNAFFVTSDAGNVSIRVKVQKFLESRYYDLQGQEIPKSELSEWFYPKKDREIEYLNIRLDNLVQVTMNGKVYELTD